MFQSLQRIELQNMLSYLKSVLEVACLAFTVSVAFFGAMQCSTLFVLWLLFTPMFPVVLVYLTWTFVFNWSAPRRGGREFGSHFMRRLPLFRFLCDYFPISLVKTSQLDPGRNYIFGYHPHSVSVEGAFYSFATEALGFSEKFPGIKPHLAIFKQILSSLLHRDLLMSLGIIDVSREGLEYILTKMGPGHSTVIVVGGQHEILETRAGSYDFLLERRKGFIRLALETGAFLVPVIGFGQNDTHTVLVGRRGTWFGDWQRSFHARYGATPFLFYGRFGTLIPKRVPIHVVVGAPIPVERIASASQEQVEELHAKYKEKLRELFCQNKKRCGVPESMQLNIY